MAQIPLFTHFPVSDSVAQALPFIEEKAIFTMHSLKLDHDLFPVLLDLRPCVAIFSIPGPEHARQVCGMVEAFRLYRMGMGFPQRDPTLRIILVAEQRAVAIERWHELGVHEFIIAPILPRALAFKVIRHHQRATISHIPEPELAQEEEVVVIHAENRADLEPGTYKVLETHFHPEPPSDSETRYKPAVNSDPTTAPSKKIAVVASIPELQEQEGQWVRNPLKAPSSASEEKDGWEWTFYPPKDKTAKRAWSYRGDRPTYDKNAGGWKLIGEKPELTVRDESGKSHRMIHVEETEKGPEVVIDDRIDVQKVSQRTYRRHTPESSGPQGRKPLTWEALGGEGSKKPRWGVKTGPEETTTDQKRGLHREQNDSEENTPPPWKALKPDAEASAQEEPRPREESEISSQRRPSRRDLTQDSEPEDYHSLYGDKGESGSESDPRRDVRASLSNEIKRKLLDRENGDEELIQPIFPEDLAEAQSNAGLEAEEKEEEAGSPLIPDEDSELEREIEKLSGRSTGRESDQEVSEEGAPEERHPMFDRLEAALLGEAPKKRPAGEAAAQNPYGHGLGRSQKELDERPQGATTIRGEEPNAGKHLRLDPAQRKEREINLKSGEGEDPSKLLELKTSGSRTQNEDYKVKASEDVAGTWSMQNLDDSGGLGKSEKIARIVAQSPGFSPDTPSETFALVEKVLAQVNQTPMDPAEKARLLKKVYENLNLKKEKLPEEVGFFKKILRRVISYLKAEED